MTGPLADLAAERAYLSAIVDLNDGLEAYPLPPEAFTSGDHRHVYAAVLALRTAGKPVDYLSICTELQRSAGWPVPRAAQALIDIQNRNGHGGLYSARGAAARLRTYLEARSISEAALEGASAAGRLDVEGARERLAQVAFGATEESEALSALQLMEAAADDWYAIADEGGRIERGEPPKYIGLKLGRERDVVRLGPGDLLTVAAATGVGKSSMGLTIMLDLEDRGLKSGLVSVEDGPSAWGSKLIGYRGNVDTHRFWRSGTDDQGQKLGPSGDDWARATKGVEKQRERPDLIRIVHAKSGSLEEVIQQMAKLVRVHGCRLLVVDYIQAITVSTLKNVNRRDATDYVLARLLQAARVLGVPLVLMSQLSRASKTDRFPEPHLSDLKESGTLENSSNAVLLLWIETDDPRSKSYGVVMGKLGKYKLDARGDRWPMRRMGGQVLQEDPTYVPAVDDGGL